MNKFKMKKNLTRIICLLLPAAITGMEHEESPKIVQNAAYAEQITVKKKLFLEFYTANGEVIQNEMRERKEYATSVFLDPTGGKPQISTIKYYPQRGKVLCFDNRNILLNPYKTEVALWQKDTDVSLVGYESRFDSATACLTDPTGMPMQECELDYTGPENFNEATPEQLKPLTKYFDLSTLSTVRTYKTKWWIYYCCTQLICCTINCCTDPNETITIDQEKLKKILQQIKDTNSKVRTMEKE